MERLLVGATALCVGLVLTSGSADAQASAARIAWSTYLRAGPGQTFKALDELEHDTPVQVLHCDDAWCRITEGEAAGYVDKAALTLPRSAPATGLKARPDCFVSGQVDYHGQMPTRFCGRPAG